VAPAEGEDEGPELRLTALIGALERHQVEYVVVGGVAARGYGATRVTKDLDCVVRQQRENLDRLGNALKELGARLRVGRLSDEEAKLLPLQLDGASLARNQMWTLRTDVGNLDVLANIPGAGGTKLGYDVLVERGGIVQVESLRILVASLDDVIISKQVADRPKDHEALPELLAIAAQKQSAEPEAPTMGSLVEQAHPSSPPGVIPPGITHQSRGPENPGAAPALGGPQAELG
jgi:hypothetical protein